jgi:hypothetical protein
MLRTIVVSSTVRRVAYQNADAVIGLLAGEPAFVADGREFGDGEFVVGELEFLQAQYVDAARCQPVDHMLLADLEGVDVPGGNFHLISAEIDSRQ